MYFTLSMTNVQVVQNGIQTKAVFIKWTHTEVILLGVGFLHAFKTIWGLFQMRTENAEHTTRSVNPRGEQLPVFIFLDFPM